ncbi:MAG: GYF domain-containing protein [Kofleriaceae bacterium]|nr:GYF domain-containing protein [Kofleriaceae bacterium]
MKFLCDRCKTRYSIGDDRVRGKILKIRCKNCANVITVREGMNDVDASDPEGLRKRGPTQAVPLSNPAQSGLNGDHPAPGSAAAPAALEQEWYVSIDGQQEGPFSLSDAQTWVGSKPYDAELHCWSEGFDDWLPVDKVSHFRALRKKPAPPPPVPRAATVPAPPRVNTAQAASVEREPEPKPLFAATMASIERSSPTERPPGFGMPAPIANATPPGGERAMPLAAKNGAPVPAAAPAKSKASPSRLPTFDVNDQPTQLEASSFDEPAAAANDLFAKALGASSSAPATMPLATPSPVNASTLSSLDDDDDDDDDDSDDDLQIGEVSRVVNLADLKPRAKPAEAQPRPAPAAINRTGSMPRIGGSTAAVPRIGGNTAAVPSIDDPDVPMAPLAAPADSMLAVPPQVASSHRRGMLLLIGAAAAVLIGGIVAVVLIVSSGDNGPLGGLGRGDDIDTTRPDVPLRKLDPKVGSGAGSQVATNPTNVIKRPNTGGGTTGQRPQTNVIPKEPDPPVGGDKLGGEEIETMARNNGAGTQRCYMRAQRGAEAILIGDVKKVLATLTIAPDGKVTGVSLDKHADNNFGKCLISTISGWKFRTSPGGTFRLTLQFVST